MEWFFVQICKYREVYRFEAASYCFILNENRGLDLKQASLNPTQKFHILFKSGATNKCYAPVCFPNTALCLYFFRPKRHALFHVDLLMDKDGVYYSNNLNSFEATLIALFDKGIQSTQNVPQLEKVFCCSLIFEHYSAHS